MKKLFGFLAICSLVACTDSSDTPSAPAWNGGNNQQGGNQNAQNTDPNQQAAIDSLQNLLNQMSQQGLNPGLSSQNLLASSSSDLFAMSSSSSLNVINNSSSSVQIVNNSSQSVTPGVVVSSSSQNVVKSSSSNPVTPKSSAVVVDEGIKLELWDPASGGDIQIKTGNAKAGWWYGYDDNKDSNGEGASTLTWKVPAGEKDDMTPVIEACGGICGDFDLVVGANPYKPYVGFGFNLNATANATGDATANQSGFCVEYTFVPEGDSEMMIELGLGSKDASIGYANPFVTLDPTASPTVQNVTWSGFAQPTWAETKITGANAAKTLASIKFKIAGTTDGEDGGSGSFSITKFGPLNGCN